jgi:hypothetical protein
MKISSKPCHELKFRGRNWIIRGEHAFDREVIAAVDEYGYGFVLADFRLTIPMLKLLQLEHGCEGKVIGGSFYADTESFTRGDFTTHFDNLHMDILNDVNETVVLYTYKLLTSLALEYVRDTTDNKWTYDQERPKLRPWQRCP